MYFVKLKVNKPGVAHSVIAQIKHFFVKLIQNLFRYDRF